MKLIEAVKKTKSPIVIYGGRFQGGPGLHHYKTYEWLVKKFGRQNVYVVMTDVKGPQSPFSFVLCPIDERLLIHSSDVEIIF